MSKNEVRGYLLAAQGAGLIQLFAFLMGIPELYRIAGLRCLFWLLVAVGGLMALIGLALAAHGRLRRA